MFIKNSICIEILAENVLVDRQLARIPTVVEAKNIGLKRLILIHNFQDHHD
jgi:hypothetical protein